MTTPHLVASLRHVVEAATLAPSIHNTQPWQFVLRQDGFDLLADPQRRLEVLDPTGRQLHLSCGAALVTARLAARALGLDATIVLLPDAHRPELLARLTLTAGASPDDGELALALAVLKRHTVRDAFDPTPVPAELLAELADAAEAEGGALRRVCTADDRLELAVLLSRADAAEEHDPAYRRELQQWLKPPETGEGLPPEALGTGTARGSSLRLRDFTLTHPEQSSGVTPAAEEPEVVVLTTPDDGPQAWLRAGMALGSVLLHAAAAGVQAQPLGQVVDLPGPRAALKHALGLAGVPQMVLRLGYVTAHATTPRRDLTDVLVAQ